MTARARVFVVILLVMFILVPTACAPSETTPPPPDMLTLGPDNTFMPILVPTSSPEKAKIMVPNYYQGIQFKDTLERLNKSLEAAGVNVEIVLSENGNYLDTVKSQLVTGKTKADAYAISRGDEASIPENVELMDVQPMMPVTAPLYFSRYKDAFKNEPLGLPVGLSSFSFRVQMACMLRQDIENQYTPVLNTLSDVLDFIDTNFVQQNKNNSILADPLELVEMWAYEKGLYPLGGVYSDGYFFARIEDKQCKPVLLEKVQGFYEFIDRITPLYKKSYLSHPHNPAVGFDVVGLFRNLGDYYQPDSNLLFSWLQGQYVAHELYAQWPSFYVDNSDFRFELLIPAKSTASVDVMKFVEWLYTSQDNYNTVLYGQKGVDYKKENDRLVMLKDGSSANIRSVTDLFKVFMFWPGAVVFGSSDYNIVPASAPINIDSLFDNGKGVQRRFPFEEVLSKANEESKKLFVPTNDMRPVMDKRNELLGEIIYSMFNVGYAGTVKSLELQKNDWVLAQYENMINKFKDSVDKQ